MLSLNTKAECEQRVVSYYKYKKSGLVNLCISTFQYTMVSLNKQTNQRIKYTHATTVALSAIDLILSMELWSGAGLTELVS